jgi:hypothetical protein
MQQPVIEGGGHADGLRKNGSDTRSGHTMQGLVPPVVFGYMKPWDGRRIVHHLVDLLFRCHPGDQVMHADIKRTAGI